MIWKGMQTKIRLEIVYKLWMFVSVMTQKVHEVKDVIVLFNEEKPSWMEHFIFHWMNICSIKQVREHSLFVSTCTQIRIFKQI